MARDRINEMGKRFALRPLAASDVQNTMGDTGFEPVTSTV